MTLLALFSLDAVTGRLLSSVLSVLLLALALVPLERAFAAEKGQPMLRRGISSDIGFMLGQHIVFSAVSVAVLAWLFAPLHRAPWLAEVHTWTRSQSLWLTAPLCVVLGDLVMYGHHRLQHRVPLLWRFHAIHHTTTELDWVAAHREHPVDGLCTQACMNLPAVALGLPLEAVLGLITFRGIWSIFIHSNATVPLGPLAFLLGAPQFHRWHHARDHDVNFGNLAPWADVLFGTHHDPGQKPNALGVSERAPDGYFRLLLWPFQTRDRSRSPRTNRPTGRPWSSTNPNKPTAE